MSLICDGIGQVPVAVVGDLAAGGYVTVTDGGPVRLSRAHGIQGTGSRTTARVDTSPAAPGVDCRSTPQGGIVLTWKATVDAATASAWTAAHGAPPAQRLRAVSPEATAAAPTARYATTRFPYETQIRRYLSTRRGAATVAVSAPGSTSVMTYTKSESHNVTASIVKVDIMATVMRRAQEAGRGLSSWERSQLKPMIRNSDNAAASRLWNYVGRGRAVARVNGLMGLRSTTMGPGGYWGLTVTTAPDQVQLVGHFSRSNAVLSSSNRTYGLSLMRSVSAGQNWGVTAGPPVGYVAVKNGWLPRTDGWHVNSDGYSSAAPRPYNISVLTHSTSASMATQVATINGVSRIIWSHQRVASAVQPTRGSGFSRVR